MGVVRELNGTPKAVNFKMMPSSKFEASHVRLKSGDKPVEHDPPGLE